MKTELRKLKTQLSALQSERMQIQNRLRQIKVEIAELKAAIFVIARGSTEGLTVKDDPFQIRKNTNLGPDPLQTNDENSSV